MAEMVVALFCGIMMTMCCVFLYQIFKRGGDNDEL